MPRRELHDTIAVDAAGPQRVRELVRHALATDARFNSDFEGMRRAGRIADAVGAEPSPAPVFLDEGDWEKLCEALRAPMPLRGAAPYLIAPAHACMPLVLLVLDAKQENP